MFNPFSKTNEALIIYTNHKQGCVLQQLQMDLTQLQKYFLSLMSVEDISNTKKTENYLKLLCQSQGIKFNEDKNDRFSVRNQALQRQRKRLQKKEGING